MFAALPPNKWSKTAAPPPGAYTFSYWGDPVWYSYTPGNEYADLNDDNLTTEFGVQFGTAGGIYAEWPSDVLLTSVFVRCGNSGGRGGWSEARSQCVIEAWSPSTSSWDVVLYVTDPVEAYKKQYDFPASTVASKLRLTPTAAPTTLFAMSELQFV